MEPARPAVHLVGSHAPPNPRACLPCADTCPTLAPPHPPLPSPGPELSEESAAREDQWGAPKGEPGQWASCLR